VLTSIHYSFEKQDKVIEYTDGEAGKPLVLLLHGAGGTISDMTSIDDTPYPHYDYSAPFPPDRDEGWALYPGVGVWSFTLDGKKDPLVSWRQILQDNGFPTATYGQVDSTGRIEHAEAELEVVVNTLSQPPISVTGLPAKELVILCHSRGGLLTRKFLKDHADLVPNLSKVITIDSPHQGSELANLARSLGDAIAAFPNPIRSLIEQALGDFATLVEKPAWQELSIGSAFLQELQKGEAALPGVQYFTFGGISVKVTRVLSWVYTLGSAIPQWHWPPFHHVITMVEVPLVSPVCNSLPPFCDEITNGKGDILTADARCRLPFAVHRTNAINHAECLFDAGLQAQVLAILGDQTGFWE
jgi:pimeloyl-ACP methyl ester carboxylesterase